MWKLKLLRRSDCRYHHWQWYIYIYVGEVVEIKIDNVNGKHSTVFKNDDGVNEALISKLLGVLKWLRN